VNDTYVNLRQSPNGKILRPIPNGERISIDTSRRAGDWSFVVFDERQDNASGYIKNSFLFYNSVPYVLDYKDNYVNLRITPSGRIIRQVKNGTPLTILSQKTADNWVKVKLNIGDKATGYISSDRIANPRCKADGNYFDN
jgi:uncharacterized protein YgiM (DUF1202 family)